MTVKSMAKVSVANPNGELKILCPNIPPNFDPQRMEDAHSMMIALQVHRGLFRYSPAGEVFPDLVDSWRASEDHKTYHFKLKGATFSDGMPITAEHVRQSFARLDLDFILGAEEFRRSNNISKLGIKVFSDSEFEIKLKAPSAIFTKQLASVDAAIFPLKNYRFDAIDQHTASAGPYKITSVQPGSVIIEKWRSDLFDSPKPPKRINFIYSDKDPLEVARSHQTDSLDRITLDSSLESELIKSGWSKTVTDTVYERYVILNPTKMTMKIRKYLYSRVNPELIVKAIGGKDVLPAYGIIPFGVPGALTREDVSGLLLSPIKAPRGTIDLEFSNQDPILYKIANTLKSSWETQHFKVNLVPLKVKDLFDTVIGSKGFATISGKGLDFFDGYSALYYFKSDYQLNYFHVKDSDIDRDLEESITMFNQGERITRYRSTQLKILRHFTVIPLAFGSNHSGLWSPRTKLVPAHPGGQHTLPMETIELQ